MMRRLHAILDSARTALEAPSCRVEPRARTLAFALGAVLVVPPSMVAMTQVIARLTVMIRVESNRGSPMQP
jgi:hypothetical protein